jgi:hypothetical protein
MRSPRWLVLALPPAGAWLALWLAACGSSGSSGRDSRDDAASPDGRADASDAATGFGIITFSEAPDAAGTFFAGFSASAADSTQGCAVVDSGACSTVTCPPPPSSDGGADGDASADAHVSAAPNPGRLKVSGGVFGQGFFVDPDKEGTYLYASPGTIFSPGDTLSVEALGGVLPAFPGEGIVAPALIDLTAPGGDGGKITVSTVQPLTFAWTGGAPGEQAVVTANALFTTGGGASMTCNWDATLGTGTAPSEVLRPLGSQNAVSSNIVWYQLSQRKFTTGPIAVSLSAYAYQIRLAAFQ